MRYKSAHIGGMLPLGAFEHCGDRRIKLYGAVDDAMDFVGDVVGGVGDVVGGALDTVGDVVDGAVQMIGDNPLEAAALVAAAVFAPELLPTIGEMGGEAAVLDAAATDAALETASAEALAGWGGESAMTDAIASEALGSTAAADTALSTEQMAQAANDALTMANEEAALNPYDAIDASTEAVKAATDTNWDKVLEKAGSGALKSGLTNAGIAAITGGDPLTAGLKGALTGGIGAGVGNLADQSGFGSVGSTTLGGLAGGATGAVLNGRDPLTGALIGGVNGLVTSGINVLTDSKLGTDLAPVTKTLVSNAINGTPTTSYTVPTASTLSQASSLFSALNPSSSSAGALPGSLQSTGLTSYTPASEGKHMSINNLKQLYPQLANVDPRILSALTGKQSNMPNYYTYGDSGGQTNLSSEARGGTPQPGYNPVSADARSGNSNQFINANLPGFNPMTAAGLRTLNNQVGGYIPAKTGGHIQHMAVGGMPDTGTNASATPMTAGIGSTMGGGLGALGQGALGQIGSMPAQKGTPDFGDLSPTANPYGSDAFPVAQTQPMPMGGGLGGAIGGIGGIGSMPAQKGTPNFGDLSPTANPYGSDAFPVSQTQPMQGMPAQGLQSIPALQSSVPPEIMSQYQAYNNQVQQLPQMQQLQAFGTQMNQLMQGNGNNFNDPQVQALMGQIQSTQQSLQSDPAFLKIQSSMQGLMGQPQQPQVQQTAMPANPSSYNAFMNNAANTLNKPQNAWIGDMNRRFANQPIDPGVVHRLNGLPPVMFGPSNRNAGIAQWNQQHGSNFDNRFGGQQIPPGYVQNPYDKNFAPVRAGQPQVMPAARGLMGALSGVNKAMMAAGGQPFHHEGQMHIPQFKTGTTGHYVQGAGDGQSDDIPAMLADGEYVIDADTVAALGNGSNKAGALQLDKMRQAIREHKRSAPSDKIPPKAKSPMRYMKGG